MTRMPQASRFPLTVVVAVLALLAITTLAYWPGLTGHFLFDDYPNIVRNSRVHAEEWTINAFVRAASAYEPGYYGRPLATVSFAINYLLGGKEPWGYKFGGLLVHVINAGLVFWLLRRLLALPRVGGQWSIAAAFAVALLWAVHPLQVSSVLYIVQRMETLSLTFVLLGLITYVRGRTLQTDGHRGWPWLVGSCLLAGIGMLSKESAILFPAFTLALELTVLGFDAQRPRIARALAWSYVLVMFCAIAAYASFVLPTYLEPQAFSNRGFSVGERLLTQLRVLPMYLQQMLLPLPGNFYFYYDAYNASTGLLSPPTTLLGASLLLALFGLAWRYRHRAPVVSLGVFWFFAAHALTSNVINLELAFEHRNYFALLGIMLSAAELVRRIPMRDSPRLKVIAVGAVILCFAGLTVLRAAAWGNPLHLAIDMTERSPRSVRASSDLAMEYLALSKLQPDSRFYQLALREFERGAQLPGASPQPDQALILMAAMAGQPVESRWWDQLIGKLRTRPIGPQEISSISSLMKERYKGLPLDDHKLSEAYATILARGPMPPQMYAQYGDFALTYLRDESLATGMFVAAIERDPRDAAYADKIIHALLADGHMRQAKAVAARARELGMAEQVSHDDSGSTKSKHEKQQRPDHH